MFCNDEALAKRLIAAADEVDDPIWRMPLWRNYRRFFDSDIADFNNSGRGGMAGAVVAALFLDYFIPDNVAWAHFDTFAWNDVSRPGRPTGGEALGLRAVFQAILS
jgi:leucyl aminopeptidase